MRAWRLGRCGALTVLLCACAGGADPENASRDGAPAAAPPVELASSLEVDAERDSVWLRLHVTNRSSSPVELVFPTAQRYEFVVRTPSGAEVWRWSSGRAFAQVVGREVLGAGETRTYEAVWDATSAPAGTYEAVARLTTRERAVEQRTVFEIE